MTHREYYSQFVTDHIKTYVQTVIGLKTIIGSKDESFNDIPLKKWDTMHNRLRTAEIRTMSQTVCLAKEAAKQIKEEYFKNL